MSEAWTDSLARRRARSRALYAAIADKLRQNPEAVLALARRNLERLAHDPHSAYYYREWKRWLDAPVDRLCTLLTDPGEYAETLRPMSPFAGVLTPAERWAIYRRFARRQ
jgi:hypothetical protein